MMAAGVPEVEVESITVVDGQGGNQATQLASFVEQLRQTTGIDATQIARNLSGNGTMKSIKKVPEVPEIKVREVD